MQKINDCVCSPHPALLPIRDNTSPSTKALATSRDTATDFYQVTVEVQVAIYNSILLAWKEKVGGYGLV